MRTIFKRALSALAVTAAASATALTATPAQAAILVCNNYQSATVCSVQPDTLPATGTATSFSLSPNPSLVSTSATPRIVKLTGTVKNLLSGANGSLAGKAEIRWKRQTGESSWAPTALIATVPVSATGQFSLGIRPLHTGELSVRYLGNASSWNTNGRLPSTSAKKTLTVLSPVTTVVNVSGEASATNWFPTRRFVMDPTRPLTVKTTMLCSAPVTAMRVWLDNVGNSYDPYVNYVGATAPNDTDFSLTTTFSASDVRSFTGRVLVLTNRNCSVSITATQQKTVY